MQKNQGKNNQPEWCFIVNPMGGGGLVRKRWPKIELALRHSGVDFQVRMTERPFHAAALAAEAIENGCRSLVAVGGDGTAHEVINGIFSQELCPPESITFTLLPVGTGNDWVKTHRIPKNFNQWFSCFRNGHTTLQDVGLLRYQHQGETLLRYFINVAGLSYDGYVVKKSSEGGAHLPHFIHYMWATVSHLFGFQIPSARVVFGEQKMEGKFYTINIGICRYSGGGMQLVPQARPNDGLLALTIARKIPKLMVLLSAPLFYTGKIGWHPKASLFSTKKVEVERLGDLSVYLEADGEFLGEAPVQVELAPQKLKILVPKA